MNRILRRSVIWAIVPTMIFTPLLIAYLYNITRSSLFLHVSMKSSVNTFAQIYYDIGRGLNSTDSFSVRVTKDDTFHTLRFPLPGKTIRSIRFDPASIEGRFWINDITIIDDANHILQHLNLHAIQPLNEIQQIHVVDQVLTIETVPAASDPMVSCPFVYPISAKQNILLLAAFAVIGICGILAMLSFIFFAGFYLNAKYAFTQTLVNVLQHYFTFIKRNGANLLLFFLSLCGSAFVAYYIYHQMVKPSPGIVYQGQGYDYGLSFYNSKGQRISTQGGTLKLLIDPFTIYRNYPKQQSLSYSINADGFREGHSNEPGKKLAMVLGGSAAFGQGLPDNADTFAAQINQLNPYYRIVNSAVVGFLSGQELAQMIHYLDDFHPALYIVFDGWNDIFIPYASVKRWPVQTQIPIGYNNEFYTLEDQLAAYVEVKNQGKKTSSEDPLPTKDISFDQETFFAKVRDTYLANLDKMNAFANARGAKLVIVSQPEVGNKIRRTATEQKLLQEWDKTYGYLRKDIPQIYKQLMDSTQKFCTDHQISYININKESAFTDNPETLFYDVVHPNEIGHQIIAKIINRTLLEQF